MKTYLKSFDRHVFARWIEQRRRSPRMDVCTSTIADSIILHLHGGEFTIAHQISRYDAERVHGGWRRAIAIELRQMRHTMRRFHAAGTAA